MAAVVADTHAILWYLLRSRKLSSKALRALNNAFDTGAGILVSSISIVEAIFLTEKGSLPSSALEKLRRTLDKPGSGVYSIPVDPVVAWHMAVIPRGRVPDMPDRIIAATAHLFGLPLVTHDEEIGNSGIETIW